MNPATRLTTFEARRAATVTAMWRRASWNEADPVGSDGERPGLTTRQRLGAAVVGVLVLAGGVWVVAGGEGGSGGPERDEGIALVVDTDLAADDLVALLFLLTSPDADVRAITISGTGEVRCPHGVAVATQILAVTGHEDIPVACGRSAPLEGEPVAPEEVRDAADAAHGLSLPDVEPSEEALERDAVDLLVEQLGEGGVRLLTLGPLTNVAEAFTAAPELAEEVAQVVILGGALRTAGNVVDEDGEPTDAEWNIYADPAAAALTVASGAPVVLVPLDSTTQAQVSRLFVDRLEANAGTEPARLVAELYASDPRVAAGQVFFRAPFAAAAAIDAEVSAALPDSITVVTEEGPERGRTPRTSLTEGGHPVSVELQVDLPKLEDLLIRTLAGIPADEELAAPPDAIAGAFVLFDGISCLYEGPDTVEAGEMAFAFGTEVDSSYASVIDLTGELTFEEVVEQVRANPGSEADPPGVDAVIALDQGRETRVEMTPPSMVVICAFQGAVPLVGATITVE